MKKLALITGANRGIGFEISRQLAKKGFRVILTAKDVKKGKKATEILLSENLDIVFHQLDVTDVKSINRLVLFLKKEGKLSVLVNNAGILIDFDKTALDADLKKIKKTIDVNTFGPLVLTSKLSHLINKGGRVINMSSSLGLLSEMDGYYSPAYRISKTALNAVTVMLSNQLKEKNISVNAMCPGWVRTSMGGKNADKSIEEGADTAIWLATQKASPTGKFFLDRKRVDW